MKSIFKTIKYNLRSILLFELAYRFVFLLVMWQLFSKGINIILKRTGYSYLNVKNLFSVLGEPLTIPILLGILVIGIVMVSYEVAVLLVGFQAAAGRKSISVVKMMIFGMRGLFKNSTPARLRILPLSTVLFLSLNAFSIIRFCYYLNTTNVLIRYIRDKRFLLIVVILILMAILFYILRNSFYICGYYLEREGLKGSKQQGLAFFKTNILRFMLSITIGNVLIIFLYIFILVVSTFFMAVLVMMLVNRRIELATILVLGDYIDMVMIYLCSVAGTIINLGVIIHIYYRFQEDKKKDIPDFNYQPPEKWKKKVVIILTMVFFSGLLYQVFKIHKDGMLGAKEALNGPTITSHRGSSYDAPENTLPALEMAIENIADYVEIDIRQTKDGELVLLHDASLRRTTGRKSNIWDLNLEEVRRLDAGSWFGEDYINTRVPTFREVLELCKGKIKINVDIKYNKNNQEIVEKVIMLIKEYRMEKQSMITSTNYNYLKKVKDMDEDMVTGLIVSMTYGDYFNEKNVDFFSVNSNFLHKYNIDKAHSYGKAVIAWTVNSETEINRMHRSGVDGIITDRPIFAREILYGDKATKTLVEYLRMVLLQ